MQPVKFLQVPTVLVVAGLGALLKMEFMNGFEELETLLNLQKILLFCRNRNGLHTKALKSIEFGLPSAAALMEEGLAWKRIKEEALEEVAIGEWLRKNPGKEGAEEMYEGLRREEEELRRSYRKTLQQRLSTILCLDRLIQSSIHSASVESFRHRHLKKLHHGRISGCPPCDERAATPGLIEVQRKPGSSPDEGNP